MTEKDIEGLPCGLCGSDMEEEAVHTMLFSITGVAKDADGTHYTITGVAKDADGTHYVIDKDGFLSNHYVCSECYNMLERLFDRVEKSRKSKADDVKTRRQT